MPEPAQRKTADQEYEDWRLLQEVLEERDREWWAEPGEEDPDE